MGGTRARRTLWNNLSTILRAVTEHAQSYGVRWLDTDTLRDARDDLERVQSHIHIELKRRGAE